MDLERVEAFARCFVAAVDESTIGLKQHGRTEKMVAVPPIAQAGHRATRAENTGLWAQQLTAK